MFVFVLCHATNIDSFLQETLRKSRMAKPVSVADAAVRRTTAYRGYFISKRKPYSEVKTGSQGCAEYRLPQEEKRTPLPQVRDFYTIPSGLIAPSRQCQ